MAARVEHRRRGYTRVSAKHQVTLPVEALERAGIRTGDTLRAEVRGPGQVLLVREADPLAVCRRAHRRLRPGRARRAAARVALTVLDAGVVIALLDAADAHHAAAIAAITAARDRGDTFMLPASAYAECLVAPHRRGDDAVAVVDGFIDELPAHVEPADRPIAAAAARLRAAHGPALRLPDALVIATSLVRGGDRIVTQDAGWPAVAAQVEILATG